MVYLYRFMQLVLATYVGGCTPLFLSSWSIQAWHPGIALGRFVFWAFLGAGLRPLAILTIALSIMYVFDLHSPLWILFLCGLSHFAMAMAVMGSFKVPNESAPYTIALVITGTLADAAALCWLLLFRQ